MGRRHAARHRAPARGRARGGAAGRREDLRAARRPLRPRRRPAAHGDGARRGRPRRGLPFSGKVTVGDFLPVLGFVAFYVFLLVRATRRYRADEAAAARARGELLRAVRKSEAEWMRLDNPTKIALLTAAIADKDRQIKKVLVDAAAADTAGSEGREGKRRCRTEAGPSR